MDSQLALISGLTFIIHIVSTLAYSVYIAGTRTKRTAIALPLFNMLTWSRAGTARRPSPGNFYPWRSMICSRIAYAEFVPDEPAASAVLFLEHALAPRSWLERAGPAAYDVMTAFR